MILTPPRTLGLPYIDKRRVLVPQNQLVIPWFVAIIQSQSSLAEDGRLTFIHNFATGMTAIPQSKMDAELGYACTWSYLSSSLHPPTQKKLALAVQLLSIAKMIGTLRLISTSNHSFPKLLNYHLHNQSPWL